MANYRIGDRDHSLLARQFRSKLRRCSRSRESAFYKSGATPRPHLLPCFGYYRTHQRRCFFQSRPQTSCFTPEQDSQSRESQAPGSSGRFTPENDGQSRGSQAPVADSSEALRARPWTENLATARPDECGRFYTSAATVVGSCRSKAGDPAGPTAQVW